jgi:hypothetical protein
MRQRLAAWFAELPRSVTIGCDSFTDYELLLDALDGEKPANLAGWHDLRPLVDSTRFHAAVCRYHDAVEHRMGWLAWMDSKKKNEGDAESLKGMARQPSVPVIIEVMNAAIAKEAARQNTKNVWKRTPQQLEACSLAMYRLIAEKIKKNPALFDKARATLAQWCMIVCPSSQPYLAEWERIMEQGINACLAAAAEESEHAATLRKCAPFAGILTDQERREFLRTWTAIHQEDRG